MQMQMRRKGRKKGYGKDVPSNHRAGMIVMPILPRWIDRIDRWHERTPTRDVLWLAVRVCASIPSSGP